IPPYAARQAGARDRAVGDERTAGDKASARVDTHLAEAIAALHRKAGAARDDRPLHQRRADTHGAVDGASGDEPHAAFAEACRHRPVRAAAGDDGGVAEAAEAPGQEAREINVALLPRRAAEQRRV